MKLALHIDDCDAGTGMLENTAKPFLALAEYPLGLLLPSQICGYVGIANGAAGTVRNGEGITVDRNGVAADKMTEPRFTCPTAVFFQRRSDCALRPLKFLGHEEINHSVTLNGCFIRYAQEAASGGVKEPLSEFRIAKTNKLGSLFRD